MAANIIIIMPSYSLDDDDDDGDDIASVCVDRFSIVGEIVGELFFNKSSNSFKESFKFEGDDDDAEDEDEGVGGVGGGKNSCLNRHSKQYHSFWGISPLFLGGKSSHSM